MKYLNGQTPLTYLIWGILLTAVLGGLVTARWSVAFVALVTLAVSFLPLFLAPRMGIRLPRRFIGAIVVFLFAALFLGEVLDFYERFWWWDIALHGFSAAGLGLVGFLLVFIMFHGDKYAAPPWAMGAIAFCVAVTIGTTWEIFEFGMDNLFGMNMQKSGLVDTMGDLMVDCIGAGIGGLAGFLYLKGRNLGGAGGMIEEFIGLNRKLFVYLRKR